MICERLPCGSTLNLSDPSSSVYTCQRTMPTVTTSSQSHPHKNKCPPHLVSQIVTIREPNICAIHRSKRWGKGRDKAASPLSGKGNLKIIETRQASAKLAASYCNYVTTILRRTCRTCARTQIVSISTYTPSWSISSQPNRAYEALLTCALKWIDA